MSGVAPALLWGMNTHHRADPTWTPPHCPNRNCPYHKHSHGPWPYRKHGFYRRRGVQKPVQRLKCRTCGVTFSTQTFSTTYWQKRPELTGQILLKSVGCMALRQMAHDLHTSPETIARHLARLGRHCLLLHAQTYSGDLPHRTLAIDGFESFEFSQFFPCHFNVAVEPETDFFVHFTDSELRRKGRMTAQQKRRRKELEAQLGRPDPKAVRNGMADLLRWSLRKVDWAIVRSDEHPAYPRAIEEVGVPIRHETTHSKAPRTAHNPLWPVNLLELLIRHCQACHKRETIAFAKRRQGAIDRMAVLLVWRNTIKSHREKRPGVTPAMLRGLTDRVWRVADVLRRRLFPDRTELPTRWRQYYERRVHTRALKVNRVHDLKYAF